MAIYDVSPAFAELRPYLEGNIGRIWTETSVSRLPELVGQEDIGGGWYLWALRDAIVEAGHYRTAPEALRYFAQVGAEVNNACDAGRLDCYSGQLASVQERLLPLLPHIGRSLVNLGGQVLNYSLNEPGQPPSAVSMEEYTRFTDVTQNSVALPDGRQLPTINQNRINDAKIQALTRIFGLYKTVIPFLYGIAGICFLAVFLHLLWHKKAPPVFLVALAILMAISLRLMGLAYIEATACSAKDYLGPIYPLAIIFSFCSLVAARDAVFDKEYTRGTPTVSGP
jgi:hypothetical protein